MHAVDRLAVDRLAVDRPDAWNCYRLSRSADVQYLENLLGVERGEMETAAFLHLRFNPRASCLNRYRFERRCMAIETRYVSACERLPYVFLKELAGRPPALSVG